MPGSARRQPQACGLLSVSKMNAAEMRYPVARQGAAGHCEGGRALAVLPGGQRASCPAASDHRSLQHLNTQPHLTDTPGRWVEKLSDFEFASSYVPGKHERRGRRSVSQG